MRAALSEACLLCMCSIQNSSAADEVLRSVEETLQKFPFSYQGSRTLSGQEEGAFGWVTVNYLDERLKQVSACCQMGLTMSTSSDKDVSFCRARKRQAPSTWAEPPPRSVSYRITLMVQSRRTTPSCFVCMEMIISCTLTASCATGKIRPSD